jgi:hypothetical protein
MLVVRLSTEGAVGPSVFSASIIAIEVVMLFVFLWQTVLHAAPMPSKECSPGALRAFDAGVYKIKGDMVNLRVEPSLSGQVLGEIPIGSDAMIGDCFKKESIGSNSGCWHHVRQISTAGRTVAYGEAYLYSTAFADCFLAADLDEDGVKENIFVSNPKPSKFHVRVHDPNARVPMTWIVAESEQALWGSLSIIPKSTSGRTMLRLQMSAEACGYANPTHHYLYKSSPSPSLKKAITTVSSSDHPYYYREDIDWSPNRTLVLKHDATGSSGSQKHCLSGDKYEPCGPKTEVQKEVQEEW